MKRCGELKSKNYRCLFECIQEKGVEPFLSLANDVRTVPEKEVLIRETIMIGNNALTTLLDRNKDIIQYLKERKDKIGGLSFTNDNLFQVLNELSNDISLLTLYLENAKKLEKLRVSEIKLLQVMDFQYKVGIYRDNTGKIIHIQKYYTDGRIQSMKEVLDEEEFNYSCIPFVIENSNCSFLLEAINTEQGQYRNIFIKNFGFDGTKLPSEEELQSYEIPKQFCLK